MNSQPRLLIIFILSNLRCLVEAVETAEVYTLVRSINSIHTTWTARVNPLEVLENIELSLRLAKDVDHVNERSALPSKRYTGRFSLPKSFDARDKWPHCKDIIDDVKDQGACGSSWAIQTTGMLSDRLCIESAGSKQIVLSAEDLMTCCNCGSNIRHTCKGGDVDKAMMYWTKRGIVSGGGYESDEGCKPYSVESFGGNSTKCMRRCSNPQYNKTYVGDKNFGKYTYKITAGEVQIQREIIRYGPVTAFMMIFSDLKTYKDGVYIHKRGKYEASHIVKIIGWGENKKVKYWLCANSWGKEWGLSGGYFKVLRGKNHCQIESVIRAGRTMRKPSAREARVDRANKGKIKNKGCLVLIFSLLYIVSTN